MTDLRSPTVTKSACDMSQRVHRLQARPRFGRHVLCLIGAAIMLLAPAVWADTVEVSITGIAGELKTNVRRYLSIAQEHKEPWSERRIRRLFRLSRSEVRQALEPFGYYNPRIDATLKPPTGDGGNVWHATYRIDPGPPTTVKKLTLKLIGPGKNHDSLEQVLAASALHVGDQLHHSDYKATKSALSSAAYAAGYLAADFTKAVIKVHPPSNTATIKLVMDTGERYYFGHVKVEQDFLKPSFVQRFIPIKLGDPFDADRLLDLQLILSDTGYFSQVFIDAKRDQVYRVPTDGGPPHKSAQVAAARKNPAGQLRVPVIIDVKPSASQQYRISVGYGTDTGPRFGFGVTFPHINEYGHQVRIDLRVSAIARTLHAAYDIPIENVIQDRLSFTAEVSNQQFGDVLSNYASIGVVRDTSWSLGRHRAYLKLRFERYDLQDGGNKRDSVLLYPGYDWTLRWVNDVLHTRKGVALEIDVRGASQALGSSTDFLRAKVTGGLVWPLTDRTRLLLRGAVGAMAVDEFKRVPPSQRFFAGGGSSVRGYGYQELSPTTTDGTDVGGQFLAVGSIEVDYRFYKDFYLATFFDIGNATRNFPIEDFKRGVGIGFRWASPIGMIRLDLAHPLDDPDTSIRIHFSIGPAL